MSQQRSQWTFNSFNVLRMKFNLRTKTNSFFFRNGILSPLQCHSFTISLFLFTLPHLLPFFLPLPLSSTCILNFSLLILLFSPFSLDTNSFSLSLSLLDSLLEHFSEFKLSSIYKFSCPNEEEENSELDSRLDARFLCTFLALMSILPIPLSLSVPCPLSFFFSLPSLNLHCQIL